MLDQFPASFSQPQKAESKNVTRVTIHPKIMDCHSGPLTARATRFGPGTDLLPALQAIAGKRACVVLSAVGSIKSITLRTADASAHKNPLRTWDKPMEIVSMTGTVSVSDETGSVFGGHLVSGTSHTTLELVLGSIEGVVFHRKHDDETGYKELEISSNAE